MGLETGTYVSELVSTNPINTDNTSQGDDHLRLIKSVLQATFPNADQAFYTSEDFTDLASAATCAIGGVASLAVNITGTTTITSFGTIGAGIWRFVKFAGALTLTHNAVSLILPGGANITTAAGDTLIAFSRGAGNWVVLTYFKASGQLLIGTALLAANNLSDVVSAATTFGNIKQAATTGATGVVQLADQAAMEAAASTTLVVTPGRQQFHPATSKCWARVTVSAGVPTLQASYNITSITDTAVGRLTITIATDFSTANYCPICAIAGTDLSASLQAVKVNSTTGLAVGSLELINENYDGTGPSFNNVDPVEWYFVAYGDQ